MFGGVAYLNAYTCTAVHQKCHASERPPLLSVAFITCSIARSRETGKEAKKTVLIMKTSSVSRPSNPSVYRLQEAS